MDDGIWGYIRVTAGRQSGSTTTFMLRRTAQVVYPFSHFILSVTSLSNPQRIMVKTTIKDLMLVMGSRSLSTASLPANALLIMLSLSTVLKYRVTPQEHVSNVSSYVTAKLGGLWSTTATAGQR